MKVYPQVFFYILLFILTGLSTFVFADRLDPAQAKLYEFIILYFLVFLTAFSLFASLGYFTRLLFWRRGERFQFLYTSRRQAVWLGLVVVSFLILSSQDLLNLWTAASFLIFFIIIEAYAVTR